MIQEKRIQAIFELVFAAALWGFGFIAAKWSMHYFTALEITFLRLSIPSFLFYLMSRLIKPLRITKDEFRGALLPGVFLAGILIPQTIGLAFTTATKSGFITTLYVLIVPFLDWIYSGYRPSKKLALALFIAFLGTACIVELDFTSWNLGDSLTLICAFFASAHIFIIDQVSKRKGLRPFHLNMAQCFWASLFALTALILFDKPPLVRLPTTESFIGFLMITFGSTLVAFSLQFKAQKRLNPSVASILFLLESPFALGFALLFLNETLSLIAGAGAVLIILACLLVISPSARTER